MTDALPREEFEALCDRLADDVVDRLDGGADPEDALWDAVSAAVPRLTRPVCDAILDRSARDPIAPLVAQVTADRGSDEDERRRAQAITVLLQEVDRRVADRDEYDVRPELGP